MSETTPEPEPKRRWYHYRLWHLFVLITVGAIACSWFACRMRAANRRKEAMEKIESDGGWLAFKSAQKQSDEGGFFSLGSEANETQQPEVERHRDTVVGVDYTLRKSGGMPENPNPVDLSRLKHLRGIESIGLSGQDVSNEGLIHLSRLPRLQSLDLSWTAVGDEGLMHLQDVKSLEFLDLSYTAITDAGLRHLRKLTRLRHLILNETAVTDIGLKHLSKLGRLEQIGLRGTQVDGSGLDALAPSLLRLDMSCTPAKDSTVLSLPRFSKLEFLGLRDTRVTNRVCRLLHGMNRLETANLEWTFATESGIEATRSRLKADVLVDTRLNDREIEEILKIVESTDDVDQRILAFSREHGQIHVHTGVNRGHANGDGDILIMEKREGKWTVVSLSGWSS